jgi:hypothetical protein
VQFETHILDENFPYITSVMNLELNMVDQEKFSITADTRSRKIEENPLNTVSYLYLLLIRHTSRGLPCGISPPIMLNY